VGRKRGKRYNDFLEGKKEITGQAMRKETSLKGGSTKVMLYDGCFVGLCLSKEVLG
jgi:hypothetical protein